MRHTVATGTTLAGVRPPEAPHSRAAQAALIAVPPILVATTYAAFNGFVAMFGFRWGYFLGFAFKWGVWCLAIPWLIVGGAGVRRMFGPGKSASRDAHRFAWVLLTVPLLIGYAYAFPRALPHATVAVILLSALIALVNGTLEEVLWRGTYVQVFDRNAFLGYVYPSLGFGLWHLAPQSVLGGAYPGGVVMFVGVAFAFGLCWGWVAHRTGTIRWVVLSHVLLDFSGLGALVYFR